MSLTQEYIRKIGCFIDNIPKRIYKSVEEFGFAGFFTYDRLSLDEAKAHERQSLSPGMKWGKKWEYGWFFTKITIPKSCEGKRVIFAAKQGESLVFVNGKVVGAFDREHTHITLAYNAKGGETFDIAMEVYAGHFGSDDLFMRDNKVDLVIEDVGISEFQDDQEQKTVTNGNFGIFYEEVFQLWVDIKTLYDLRNNLEENSLRKAKIDKALMKMCDAVNIELPMDEFIAAVQRGREILKPELDCKNGSTAPLTYAIGHSHLDLEWLWTTAETRRKAARTLGNQLKLIEEYPEYKYIQSQPWLLETVKNEYPDLYQEVKKAVKNGNIIVEGGMYVESDANILSGESLIRQFIFGKKFIKEEFGTESEIFWLPDSFGMTASLPQIMKGCEIKYFLNDKIMWQYNGGDEIPHSNFMWQGIDGSEILTHLSIGYAHGLEPKEIFFKWGLNKEKADVPISLIEFGHGDGGGGATRIHLEYLKREKDLEGMSKVVSESPKKFFEKLDAECEIKEKYVGELYYTAHRGAYTSQAKTKKFNRQSEFALREAELWSALLDNNTKAETDALWKTTLFNQFHDISPGTSITAVHEQTEKELTEVISKANGIADKVCNSALDSSNDCITVFNSLSWEREAIIELPDGYTSIEGCDTQKIGDKAYAKVSVPACGYKAYKLGKDIAGETKTDNGLVLENNLIRAEFNTSGELISVFDKTENMEFLSKPSNVFRMYQDMTCFFDAWDIDSYYENQEMEIEKLAEVYVEYKGDLQSSIVIKRKINNSFITQRAILRNDSKRIDFETEVDWRETHKLLKVDFNTNIHTEELVSEIQFGYIKRPNHKTRQYDADRFEVCNHKWSALCENKRGVAILNNCKYGISADNNRMSLTLLRATVNPARFADKGMHTFTYSIMPFAKSLTDSNVVEEAYNLNCPVAIKQGFAGERSLLNVSERNVIVDTVKLAEDGSGDIIIRMYESKNTYTTCKLKLSFNAKSAYIVNMLEENKFDAELNNNEISLDFKAFEVITLRIKR